MTWIIYILVWHWQEKTYRIGHWLHYIYLARIKCITTSFQKRFLHRPFQGGGFSSLYLILGFLVVSTIGSSCFWKGQLVYLVDCRYIYVIMLGDISWLCPAIVFTHLCFHKTPIFHNELIANDLFNFDLWRKKLKEKSRERQEWNFPCQEHITNDILYTAPCT